MNAPDDATAIDTAHAARVAREPVLQKRLADAATKASTIKRSLSTEGVIKPLREASFARLKGEGKLTGDFETFEKAPMLGRAFWDTFGGGYYNQVDLGMQSKLAGVAKQHGIDWHAPTRTDAKTGEVTTEYAGDEAIAELVQRLQAMGVNPMESVVGDTREVVKLLESIDKKLDGPGKPNGAGPTEQPNGKPTAAPPPLTKEPGRM